MKEQIFDAAVSKTNSFKILRQHSIRGLTNSLKDRI